MAEREQQRLLREALAREAEAQRLLLAGDPGAAGAFREVADLYRGSWGAAHSTAYGRLVGMLKAAILAGDASAEAEYVRKELGREMDSPTRAYAVGLAALVEDDDELALRGAEAMAEEGDAFARAASAIDALARGDATAYSEALAAVIADFEARGKHLTGIAIADTAAVLEVLAEQRGMATKASSGLLPPPLST